MCDISWICLTNVLMVYYLCFIYLKNVGTPCSWYMHPTMYLQSVPVPFTFDYHQQRFGGISLFFHQLQSYANNQIMVYAPHDVPLIYTFSIYLKCVWMTFWQDTVGIIASPFTLSDNLIFQWLLSQCNDCETNAEYDRSHCPFTYFLSKAETKKVLETKCINAIKSFTYIGHKRKRSMLGILEWA